MHNKRSPGVLISHSGGNGRLNFGESQDETSRAGVCEVSFESNHGFDFDTVGVSDEGNIYHLHVKTFLVRYLHKVNRLKSMSKKLQTAWQHNKVLSLEARVATVIDGGVSRTQDAVIVVLLGVVMVLRAKDIKPVVAAFALEDLSCFL